MEVEKEGRELPVDKEERGLPGVEKEEERGLPGVEKEEERELPVVEKEEEEEEEREQQKHSVLKGKYELGRLLGQGSFARVYHARNLLTGKSVAMKVVGKEKVIKAGMMEQMKREISVMKRVKHPNIVQLFEVLASKSKIYLAMELVRGGELFTKVSKGGKLDELTSRSYFRQLISAVDFCHSRGVYHRDLKLENLLLDHQGNLKVTDFGLSTFHQQEDQVVLHTRCGTPHYVAPEVVSRKPQGYHGSKADIWSCGVIFFVLLAGYLPFNDDNVVRMYRKVYRGDFKCPTWFSPEACNLVTQMLDPNPSSRITVPQIVDSNWFNDTSLESAQDVDSDSLCFDDYDKNIKIGKEEPETLTAFHIISLSQGFDLSPLFEEERQEMRFAITKPASMVISTLEEVAAKAGTFTIKKAACESVVRLQGQQQGRKGKLAIEAKIFSVSQFLLVVQVNQEYGDTQEYNHFCANHLRPALHDLV